MARRPRAAARGTPRDGARRVAAIDIGSNSIRQVVADVTPDGAIRVVDEMKAAPRLGAGLARNGELTSLSIQRAVEAIARMSTLAKQLGASRIEAVATSAVREGSNARQFLDLVRDHTGLHVRVLKGDEEARLCHLSAVAHFEMASGRTVVMDIGGGSVELALSADGVLEHLRSLPFGAIRTTERFLGEAPRPRDMRALRRAVRDALREAIPAKDWWNAKFIGSGGTFTNLAGMYLARSNIKTSRSVHGTHVPRSEVERILSYLQSLSVPQRLSVPGLNAGRADIIVGGIAAAAETMAHFRARGVLASAYGIREGLLLRIAKVTPAAADPGQARERSLLEFAQRCHYEQRHADTVRRLALGLFDSLGERLGLQRADRQLLDEAALLHEVGYHISYNKHHKHSYHLIMHAEFLGMSPDEQIIVANIARYHRGAEPRKKHENFGALSRDVRKRIVRLAALLRVADGLDRGHGDVVERVRVRWLGRALRLAPAARAGSERGARLECWGACLKAGLLAKVAGVPVEVVAPDGTIFSTEDEEAEVLS